MTNRPEGGYGSYNIRGPHRIFPRVGIEEEAAHEQEKTVQKNRAGEIHFILTIIAMLAALAVIHGKDIKNAARKIWDSQVSQRQTEQLLKITKVLNELHPDE